MSIHTDRYRRAPTNTNACRYIPIHTAHTGAPWQIPRHAKTYQREPTHANADQHVQINANTYHYTTLQEHALRYVALHCVSLHNITPHRMT